MHKISRTTPHPYSLFGRSRLGSNNPGCNNPKYSNPGDNSPGDNSPKLNIILKRSVYHPY